MRNKTFSRLLRGVIAAGVVLAVAVPAAAQASNTSGSGAVATQSATTTTTPTTTTTTTPTTTTPPTAVPAKVKNSSVKLTGLFTLAKHQVTVVGHYVHLNVEVGPYVAGQKAIVTIAVNGKVTHRATIAIKPGPGGKYGWLAANVTTFKTGSVNVSVQHLGNSAMVGWTLHGYYLSLADSAAYGSHGYFVQLMQQLMLARHIYIHETGVFDEQTMRALSAYSRLVGSGPGGGSFTKTIVNDLLAGRGTFAVRFPHQGRHAEGDLSDQVLALIVGGKVQWIYPISSGKYTTPTVTGSYRVYLRDPGYLPDGMYYSDFFTGGYAIHGYDPSPYYPASHGCMRLWINDAIQVYNWLAIGDWVDVYGSAPYSWGGGAGYA